MNLYHIPCENDASARETAQALAALGFSAVAALSFHPALPAFVVVEVLDDQDPAPLLDRGGYPVEGPDPIQPVAHIVPVTTVPAETTEFEEETEPDPEETDGEPS